MIDCLVGIDAVDVDRFMRLMSSVSGLSSRIFTPKETSYSLRSQAGNFAGKEALRKALWNHKQLDFTEIEILRSASGRPEVSLLSRSNQYARGSELEKIDLSISYQSNLAIAIVIVSRISPKKR